MDVKKATLPYREWFNQKRLNGKIGVTTPTKFEAADYARRSLVTDTCSETIDFS